MALLAAILTVIALSIVAGSVATSVSARPQPNPDEDEWWWRIR